MGIIIDDTDWEGIARQQAEALAIAAQLVIDQAPAEVVAEAIQLAADIAADTPDVLEEATKLAEDISLVDAPLLTIAEALMHELAKE
jgi:hypothetical protein